MEAFLSKSHQLSDDTVGHFDGADEHQHIEYQLANVVPDDRCRGKSFRYDGWAGCELRENNAGQQNDTALQTDGGVALDERHANAAGGLSCKARQRDRRNRRRHVELEKAAVDGQNHDERQHPDEQRAEQRHSPERNALQQADIFNRRCDLGRQCGCFHCRKTGRAHNHLDRALRNREQSRHQLHAVGNCRLRQHEADEAFERHFRTLQLCKAAAGFHHADHKKQHQKRICDCLQRVIDAHDHVPDPAAFEILRAGGQQRPNL